MRIHGHLDVANRYGVAGWCRDEDDPNRSVSLVVTINGEFVTRVLANAFRPDLARLGANGHLSFEVEFEEPLSALVRSVVEVRSEIDGSALKGSPAVIEPSLAFDEDFKNAVASAVVSFETEADAEERLGFLTDQIDSVLRAKERLRSGPIEREARRKLQWRMGFTTKEVGAPTKPRALVIDVRLPAAARDAGSVAIISHLQSLLRLGYMVSFVPTNLERCPTNDAFSGITILTRPWYVTVEEVLANHGDAFQVVYLHRSSVAATYAPLVRMHQPSAHLIFAVADLSSIRLRRQAETEERPELLQLSQHDAAMEQRACEWADAVITHSSIEAAMLRSRIRPNKVHVVPFAVPVRENCVPFSSRGGIAFIGGYDHAPNVDAAILLAEQIMPAVAKANLSINCMLVGSAMPPHIRDLRSAMIFPLGAIEDLSLIFERVRLTVAPLAYGAGVKGKVLDSLAAGVPCVCTPIAAEGLDFQEPLSNLVASDVEEIAALIVRLHEDEAFNARCAAAGRAYIAARASEEVVDIALALVLGR